MPVTFVTQPSLENHIRPMWEVEPAAAADGSRVIRLGETRFRLSEVARFTATTEETRHRHGRVVSMILFGIAGALYLIGVLQFELRTRFLFASFICFAVSMMSLEDVIFSRPQRLTGFDVLLRDGRRIRWTTANEAEAAAVNAVLAQHA